MVDKPLTIKVDPDSDLACALEKAGQMSVILEIARTRYRVSREPGQAGYDPERVRRSLAAYAGSWSDLDAEQLKAYISAAREEGTRSLARP